LATGQAIEVVKAETMEHVANGWELTPNDRDRRLLGIDPGQADLHREAAIEPESQHERQTARGHEGDAPRHARRRVDKEKAARMTREELEHYLLGDELNEE
jgi:hypothetical protein